MCSFPKSIALLYRVQNFPVQDRETIFKLRKLSLGEQALQSLQEKLSYASGRFAAPAHLFYSQEEWEFRENKKVKWIFLIVNEFRYRKLVAIN